LKKRSFNVKISPRKGLIFEEKLGDEMKPKFQEHMIEQLVNPLLVNIIDLNHPLVKLGDAINWEKIEEVFSKSYHDSKGRPGKRIRLMIGLHYLKYSYNLSDEEVLYRWLENPYWQYFTGEKVFQTELPIDSSSMTKFRKRLKEEELDELLYETLRLGFESGYLKSEDVSDVAVDTTVQEKQIKYPTDIQLYYDFIVLLNRFKDKYGLKLHNSYIVWGKKMLRRYSGYVHAKQYRRASKTVRKMRNRSFKLYRAIERQLSSEGKGLEEFLRLQEIYENLLERKKNSKNKLYSLWAPEVECISKGKIHKRYEFGVKTGIVCSLSKGFVFGCKVFRGNPFDGRTLKENLQSVEEKLSFFGKLKRAFVDLGYRGHNYAGEVEVYVVPRSLKRYDKEMKEKMKRRSVVEAVISHMKRMCRLDKNLLHGHQGDMINAKFSAIGHNLRLLMAFFSFLLFFGNFIGRFFLILIFFIIIFSSMKLVNKSSLQIMNC